MERVGSERPTFTHAGFMPRQAKKVISRGA
jgi:hypothetical protein